MRTLTRMVAHRIRELRERAGLSTRALGELSDVSTGLISHIEIGRVGAGLDTARKIGAVFGCSLDWLINGDGDPPTDEQMRAAVEAARARFAASVPDVAVPPAEVA